MPVICQIPSDPTDLVIQGEEMRLSAIASGVHAAPAPAMKSAQILPELWLTWLQITQVQDYPPMHSDLTGYDSRLQNSFAGTMVANNACISTPCGAVVPHDVGNHLMNFFEQADVRWQLAGVTRDNTGAALGECRVIVMEVGRQAVASAPVVAETVSDGSGNYAIEVPLNVAYQALSYKPGAPDVAGVSLNTLTPAAL